MKELKNDKWIQDLEFGSIADSGKRALCSRSSEVLLLLAEGCFDLE